MNRDAYLQALHRLKGGIESPTPADIEAITPHLTPEQRESALILEGEGSAYFAVPPVRVRHGYLVASYSQSSRVYNLDLAYVWRIPRSRQTEADAFDDTFFQGQAMAYAEEHWGDQLILDTWIGVGRVFLQDPTALIEGEHSDLYPTTSTVIHFTLDRSFGEVMKDLSAPMSEVWDRALVEFTTDEIVGMELRGGRGGYKTHNCAYCSHGLDLAKCDNCGHTFSAVARAGWATPLPEKMVTLLQERGHRFGMDPAIARQRERDDWEKWLEGRPSLARP